MNTTLSKTYTLDQLPDIANWVLDNKKDRTVLAFYGQMGAGKTTLIKEICKRLHVQDTVTSPTFALINEYCTLEGDTIYHFDFYRINKASEAYDIGAEEYLESGQLCLIEWPELAEDLLPEKHLKISIETEGNGTSRRITLD